MVARGKLRHHAAILAVHFRLRIKRVTQQSALRVVERNAGFVAGGFNAKYKQWSVRKISLLQQNYVLLYNGELCIRCIIHYTPFIQLFTFQGRGLHLHDHH